MGTESRNPVVSYVFVLFMGFILALTIYSAFISARDFFWGEQEGVIHTADCRKRVIVKEGSPETWFKKFTCTYRRTKNGDIITGNCEAVETEGGFCQTVYSYQKNGGGCTNPAYPYLGQDNQCHSDPQ